MLTLLSPREEVRQNCRERVLPCCWPLQLLGLHMALSCVATVGLPCRRQRQDTQLVPCDRSSLECVSIAVSCDLAALYVGRGSEAVRSGHRQAACR